MPGKRYSVEQIVAKLREAEKHQAQGLTIPQSCKRLGISEASPMRFRGNRWRAEASVCRCAYRTSTYMTSTALLP